MTWTKKDQAKLREYQTAQMTVAEIAGKMDKPAELIRAELDAMGYRPIESKPKPESEFLKGFQPVEIPKHKYRRITPETEQKICELRDQCFTLDQIAVKLNIASTTVKKILVRNGYPTERGKYHKTEQDKPGKINKEFDAAVDQMIEEAQAKEDAQEMTIKEVFEDIDKKFSGKEKEPAPSANDASSAEITPVIPIINDSTPEPKSQESGLSGIGMMISIESMLDDYLGSESEMTEVRADRDRCTIRFVYAGKEYTILFAQEQEPLDYIYGSGVKE